MRQHSVRLKGAKILLIGARRKIYKIAEIILYQRRHREICRLQIGKLADDRVSTRESQHFSRIPRDIDISRPERARRSRKVGQRNVIRKRRAIRHHDNLRCDFPFLPEFCRGNLHLQKICDLAAGVKIGSQIVLPVGSADSHQIIAVGIRILPGSEFRH